VSGNCWETARIPRWLSAALSALGFRDPCTKRLKELDEQEWKRLLGFCDRGRLTLVLANLALAEAPEWVRQRVASNLTDNRERYARLKLAYFEIADALQNAGIEFVLLKGLTQWPRFVRDPVLRMHYDTDVLSRPEQAMAARQVLLGLGYEPIEGLEAFPVDHLPTMLRRTGWQWKGNLFDPDIPPAVDIHFRLWDARTEGFDVPGLEQFRERRCYGSLDARPVPVFDPVDALGYSSLHMLRHWLRGDFGISHAYELAYFLDNHAGEPPFWQRWRELHDARLRRLEAICFRVAAGWFACRLAPEAEEEIRSLPEGIRHWFDSCASSPLEGFFQPNKDELWLHYCLLESSRARVRVFRRRLFPPRLPGPIEPDFSAGPVTLRRALRKRANYAAHVIARAFHHARTLPRALLRGRWWLWRSSRLGRPFWLFMGAACLFNLGAFVCVLLYNLYLLDCGYREGVLGAVGSAALWGCVAGTLPAGLAAERWGLKRTLLLSLAASPVMWCLRTLASGETALVSLAFAGGLVSSIWAVLLAPVISRLTDEPDHPRAFSVFFSVSIALGILGGAAGGSLPGLLTQVAGASSAAGAKRGAILLAATLSLLSLWPARMLEFHSGMTGHKRKYPRGAFIVRFLVITAVWNAATGAVAPFFNAYLSRYIGMRVEQIGAVFSAGQLAQVAALLLAPRVLERFGVIPGTAGMQLATGVALGTLAMVSGKPLSAVLYAAYMATQFMSEPGIYTLLMERVRTEERNGASALNFLVAFSSQAAVAALAGAGLARYGYPPVMALAAGAAACSALLFRSLPAPSAADCTPPEDGASMRSGVTG
jgi:predicted MFS family arabinose efflux permease